MSQHAEPPICPRTSAVLALYLDGDVECADGSAARADETGYDLACPDLLAEHLRNCTTCQKDLHRARRLDCMLAESAWRTATHALDETVAARLCTVALSRGAVALSRGAVALSAGAECTGAADAAVAELAIEDGDPGVPAEAGATPSPATTTRRRRATALQSLFAAVAVGACGFGAWFALGPTPPVPHTAASAAVPPMPTPVRPSTPAAASTPEPANAGPQPRLRPADGVATDTAATTDGPIEIAQTGAAPTLPALAPRLRQAPWREREILLAQLLATEAALPQRIAAAAALLGEGHFGAAGTTRALPAIVFTLAEVHATTPTEATLLADALAAARDEATVRAYLVADLRAQESASARIGTDDLATVVTAARMGSPVLDEGVRRAVRRHPELAEVVAAALREPVRASGSARLLLDLWSDLAARGGADDDLLPLLFAHQDAAVFQEVTAEIDATPAVARRVQCLLALGASPDAACVAVLRRWAGDGQRAESYAAAYALSRLPHAWLDGVVAPAAERGAFLLRAALARAGHSGATGWVQALHLTPRERALLRVAPTSRFPEVAEWFRDGAAPRAPRSDD